MQIAYFVPTPFLQTFVANEIKGVQEAGHNVVIVPLHSSPFARRGNIWEEMPSTKILPCTLFDLDVLYLALRAFCHFPLRSLKVLASLHWSARFNVYAHASLIALIPKSLASAWRLRHFNIDRIHAHFGTHTATCAGIVSKLLDVPFSFTAHAYDIYCKTAQLRNETLLWKLRNAERIFAVSKYAHSLLRYKLQEASNRIHTVYVGIPIDQFREQAALPRNGTTRLLCITRFDRKKGLDTLIDACGLLRDQRFSFNLRLYGDGPLRNALAQQIDRLSLDIYVSLREAIPQDRVAHELRDCHIFVMPCRVTDDGDMDGIPTTFMEAMATGRPVIACPISGIPELVRDGETGCLVPPNDPYALADAIIRLASDDRMRIRLGRQASTLARRQHDQRINTRQLLEFLSSPVERYEKAQPLLKYIAAPRRCERPADHTKAASVPLPDTISESISPGRAP